MAKKKDEVVEAEVVETTEMQVQQETAPAAVTPMMLLDKAMSSGAGIDQLERLLDLQMKFEADQARKSFNNAMSDFRAECPTIAKTRKGHNSTYAGLAETLEQIGEVMSKHGLSHSWRTEQTTEGGVIVTVTCTVTHKDGHSESTRLSSEPDKSGNKNSIQAIGSAVSYLQRYTLFSVLGLASREMDTDGNVKAADVETLSAEQIANIEALLAEVCYPEEKLLGWLKVDCLENCPADRYEVIVAQLEKRRK